MRKKHIYHDDLIAHLKNPSNALGFLNECLEDSDKRVFLLGLKDVAEAHGGMTKLARLTKISREHIYRMLSKAGNPELHTLQTLLHAFGFKMAIEHSSPRRKKAA